IRKGAHRMTGVAALYESGVWQILLQNGRAPACKQKFATMAAANSTEAGHVALQRRVRHIPGVNAARLTGPQHVLAPLPQSAMHIIAKTTEPVPSDSGLSLVPTPSFENSPQLDLICIPGGNRGVVQALGDQETIDFVRRQSSTARYVTSVCTGAFILGVAGLLKGRRATTHWAFAE